MDLQSFEKQVDSLLTKRKMLPTKKIGLKAWHQHFLAQTWLAHCHEGDGLEMLKILSDDTKLISGDIFNQNFFLKFEDLYPEALKTNKSWKRVLSTLVGFKGKGLGAGELYLALVIEGWTFERTDGKGDGKVAGGIRELKNQGASLKPTSSQFRVINELNESVFEGNRAGPLKPNNKSKGQSWNRWITWFFQLSKDEQLKRLNEFYSKLYPGRDVKILCKDLLEILYKDKTTDKEFHNRIGREVLKWYKDVDNWNSLIIIDQEKMTIGNIADVNNLSMFKNLQFEWKSERGGDTQALPDGYVNINI